MQEGHTSLNPGEPALAVLPRLVKETASFPENHWGEVLKKKVQTDSKDATAEEYKTMPLTARLHPCFTSFWTHFPSV